MLKHRQKFQKIIASIMVVITCTFAVPNFSQADFGGKLFAPVVSLFAALGDVVIGGLQYWMLGTSSLWSATVRFDDPNIVNMTEAINEGKSGSLTKVTIAGKTLEKGWVTWDGEYDDIAVPNIIYSPELIFSNLVPALDINFLNPYDRYDPDNPDNPNVRYKPVEAGQGVPLDSGTALHEVVAAWYTAFRNIALVGLLSVLVYIGIRIVISSSAGEKSQYKERIMDWLVALCLLFVIQYIMSFTINITQQITTIFAGSQSIDVYVQNVEYVSSSGDTETITADEEGSTNTTQNFDFAFTTNLMGYIRFLVYSEDLLEKCAYLIIYLVLVVYTVMFTFIYLKRVLYMAFFTMIAPMVALTYPLDKLSDGKAQAFNLWLREYIFNALIQPVHLALYTMLMTSSMHLATTNPIYALVAVGFLFPAEKFVKKMFGFGKAETVGGSGFATGALTMALLNRMRSNQRKKPDPIDGRDSGDYIDKGHDASSFILTGRQNSAIGSEEINNREKMRTDVLDVANATTKGKGKERYNRMINTLVNKKGYSRAEASQLVDDYKNDRLDSYRTPEQVNNSSVGLSAPENNKKEPVTLKAKDRARMRASYMGRNMRRRLRNAPKSVGKFALKYGVRGLKGVAGGMIAAIPAGVSLLASGGDARIVENIKQRGSDFMKAGRTYDEQKAVEAEKKVKAMKNDKKQLEELDKLLYKKGENISAEEWLDNNKDFAVEYAKGKIKNASTMYKAQKLKESSQGAGLSDEYLLNLAKQYENIGKRINSPDFMQSFEEQLAKEGVNQADRNTLYQNLRYMDDF